MSSIDLIWLSDVTPLPPWRLGAALPVARQSVAVAIAADCLVRSSTATAVLFWDAALGTPDQDMVQELVDSSADCWHAGLKLGMGGLPGIVDFIAPTWMLACDPPAEIEATSWRLSFRACLVRTEVLRKLGGPRMEFETLEAAALEMGHRWIRGGALVRNVPSLILAHTQHSRFSIQHPVRLPLSDELRFAYYRHGKKWAAWGMFRAVLTRYVSLPSAVRAWREVMSESRPSDLPPLRSPHDGGAPKAEEQQFNDRIIELCGQSSTATPYGFIPSSEARVSVLIPTVDRYPYLRTLLTQLRQQTLRPLEIIIVDQTAADRRQPELFDEFSDLPLRVIYQDSPGQCTSRNAGLQIAVGDCILFIDDDDEVPVDLIEKHLRSLADFRSEVSCGVADEVGAGALPADFRFLRVSDVFPTNNTMIRREVLLRSGLFDLAYNRRQRADGDLGMRMYLAGASMILNPAISVLHHHAPSGGLRKHKARTVTYAMSRNGVFSRALTSASEFYLSGRYFSPSHAREVFWQSVLGTFSIRGSFPRRMSKLLVSTLMLPATLWQLHCRVKQARDMAVHFPQIPKLSAGGLDDASSSA